MIDQPLFTLTIAAPARNSISQSSGAVILAEVGMAKLKTTGSVARELGVCEATVRNYVRAGRLPELRDESGRLLFLARDIAAFRNKREAP